MDGRESMDEELHEALSQGAEERVWLLIEAGADVEGRVGGGRSPLEAAAARGGDCVELLLKAGADPALSPEALPLAAASGCCRSLRALIGAGADIDAPDKAGAAPLALAMMNDHPEASLLLLEAGARFDWVETFGIGAAMVAAENEHLSCLEFLIGAGADIDARTAFGETALMMAVRRGKMDSVRMLLAAGCDVDARNLAGDSALALATSRSGEQALLTLQMLIDAGAQVNQANGQGISPLKRAASSGEPRIVERLLASGADIDAQDSSGRTALMAAMIWDDLDCAQVLLAWGANPGIRDLEGCDSIGIARANHSPRCLALVEAVAERRALDVELPQKQELSGRKPRM